MYADDVQKNTYHMLMEPTGNVHQVDVLYGGKAVQDGQFEIVPKAVRAAHEAKKKAAFAQTMQARQVANLESSTFCCSRIGDNRHSERKV